MESEPGSFTASTMDVLSYGPFIRVTATPTGTANSPRVATRLTHHRDVCRDERRAGGPTPPDRQMSRPFTFSRIRRSRAQQIRRVAEWAEGDLGGHGKCSKCRCAGRRATGRPGPRSASVSAPLLAGRARVAAARGDVESALRDYTASVTADPAPDVLAEFGDLYASLGRAEEAQKQYDVVAATQQLLVGAGRASTSRWRSSTRTTASRPRPSRPPRRSTRSGSPSSPRMRPAWALHRNGRHEDALPHAEAALRLGARSAPCNYHLGMILAATGDRDGARRALRQALDINPAFSPLHAPLAAAELRRLAAAG